MVGDGLTRTPWWVGRRLLAGLAALVLASTLGAWSAPGSASLAGSAAADPGPGSVSVVAVAASVPVDLSATVGQPPVVTVPAPAAEISTHAPRWNTTGEPTGGSHPRAVGQRAPPAARA
jgi:hypothetical protein